MKGWALHLSSSGNSVLWAAIHMLLHISVQNFPPPMSTQCVEELVAREMPGHRSAVTLLHDLQMHMLQHYSWLAMFLLQIQAVEDTVYYHKEVLL